MKKMGCTIIGGMVMMGGCVASFCFAEGAFATVSSLTLGIDNNNLSVDVVSTMDGTFNSSASSNITVSTDNATGYTLSIKANNSTALVNTADNTLTIPSISTVVSESDFSSSATYNNMWGYKPSKFNSANNTDYLPSPSTTGDVLDATSAANATANTYTLALGTRIDNNTAPGSYNNAFTIMAIANAIPYTISYNANAGSDTVTGMPNPSTVSSSTYAETVTLDSAEPERDGYNFLGWCTAQTADGQACTDASGTGYSAGGTWTLNQAGVSNSLTLYAVWEQSLSPVVCEAGKICYNVNSLDTTEGTMGQQDQDDSGNAIVDASTVTLLASNFSRTGYGFAGWSDVYDYATNPNAHFYGPSETITAPEGTTANGLSLYAVWVKSAGSLQDTSKVASVCSSLTTASTDGTANLSSVSALTDQRDNNTYAIARLADGNCWMIENLRLENTAEYNSDGTLAQGYGGKFAGLAAPETADKFVSKLANSLYSADGADNTINVGYYTRIPRYDNVNSPTDPADRPLNPTANDSINATSDAGMYSYGNYYNWNAATATSASTGNYQERKTSICPAGWRLPLGGVSSGDIEQGASDQQNLFLSFSYLDRKMGGTGDDQDTTEASLRWRKYPVNFVYSGVIMDGSVYRRGGIVYYWTSTSWNTSNSTFYMGCNTSSIRPGTNSSSAPTIYGSAIRCVVSGV